MFWIFNLKKRVDEVNSETKKGFEIVKKDIGSISEWIKHLDQEKNNQKIEINDLKQILSSINEEIEGIKNIVSLGVNVNSNILFKQPFKTSRSLSNKQTSVYPVQTGVQTGVQTLNLNNFSITERAILLVLLNADMKLSYDDLAVMLGKERSTIRGQINTIKQKSEGLIAEFTEQNGKKRIYINETLKEKLLKSQKVRVKKDKKNKKEEVFEE